VLQLDAEDLEILKDNAEKRDLGSQVKLAVYLWSNGDRREAEKQLKSARAYAMIEKGKELTKNGKREEAQLWLEICAEFYQSSLAHYWLGYLHNKAFGGSNNEESIRQYELALSMGTKGQYRMHTLYNLGHTYTVINNLEKATYFHMICVDEFNFANSLNSLGLIFTNEGRYGAFVRHT